MQVISAVLQDAIVPVCDMAFQPDTQSFVMVTQRLCREAGEAGVAERICCALTVGGVGAVQMRGIEQQRPNLMLDLLAIILEPAQSLNFVFAGDARIRLDLAKWIVAVEDFGESWPALCTPCHEETARN